MENKMVADGNVVIREKNFHYEFWSDNAHVMIRIFHRGRKGENTEYRRNDKLNMKREMEDALLNDGIIK